MPRYGRSHILDAQIAFDDADGQVSQLPADTDDQAGQDEVLDIEEGGKGQMQQPGKCHGDQESAQGSLPGLFRANVAAQRMSAE